MKIFWKKRNTQSKGIVSSNLILIWFFLGFLTFQTDTAQAACDPQFIQVNQNGFGSQFNRYCWSMKVWNGHLYVGTRNMKKGGEIWRYDGTEWQNVVSAGFTSKESEGFRNLEILNNVIYAGSMNLYSGAELLRSHDGTNWEIVMDDGFGVPQNDSIRGMQTFAGFLYIGLQNQGTGSGQLYRTEDGTTFIPVSLDGFGDRDNNSMHTMEVFNSQLYVGTRNRNAGLQIWRTMDGSNFEMVVGPGAATPEGFGSKRGNRSAMDMHVFNGQMYVGVSNPTRGFSVWRTSDGLTYEQVISNGFGVFGNSFAWRFATYENQVWLGTYNYLNAFFINRGASLWRSSTGNVDDWKELVGKDGIYFGYGFDNDCVWGIRAFEIFQGKLYIGTGNRDWCLNLDEAGAEVWEWPGEVCDE
ncbi:MAG: hypothetical protein SWO11_21780 [Thermodesulfobacteriota bacterium]|nr:hypothetical protein [Thermodesulfobacteriota bacterium]